MVRSRGLKSHVKERGSFLRMCRAHASKRERNEEERERKRKRDEIDAILFLSASVHFDRNGHQR